MNPADLFPELTFKTSRSGGAGGQNVNKVSTKVEIGFDIAASAVLTDEEKQRLLEKLGSKLTTEGILKMVSQSERTQLGNKKVVLEKFSELITKSLTVQKKRKPTKISKAAKERRLESKKRDSSIKEMRRRII
ncbi:MAG: alternative ribosome rescue aminoacyl-tRNA hydrolase ArfB [Bacteroidota bacterium]